MTDTRHLDAAIAILGGPHRATRATEGTGKAGATRATKKPKKAQTCIDLHNLGVAGVSVQVNHLEVWLAPDMYRARADAKHRKQRLEAMGRSVLVTEYN